MQNCKTTHEDLPESKMEEIRFESSPFNYVIEYTEDNNTIKITCSHCEEYFCWSKTISDPIQTEKCGNISGHSTFGLAMTPKLLFKILKEFCDGKLINTFELKFPESYKTVTTKLPIKINTKLPYSDDIDVKIIYLEPDSITESDRFDFKLDRMEKRISEEYLSIIKQLQQEIVELKNVLNKTTDENKKIYSKIAKIEIMGKQYAHTTDLARYAYTTDLKNYITGKDLVAHLVNYELKKLGE